MLVTKLLASALALTSLVGAVPTPSERDSVTPIARAWDDWLHCVPLRLYQCWRKCKRLGQDYMYCRADACPCQPRCPAKPGVAC